MSNSFPAEIIVDETATGVVYRLPRRPLGSYRYFGLAWIILGGILLSICILPVTEFVQALRGAIPPGQGLAWLFACIVAGLFAVGGMAITRFGFLILAGHSEIALRDGVLYAIERCGPFRRTRQRAVSGLRRFYVSVGLEALNVFGKVSAGPLGTLCVITPEWHSEVGGKPPKSLWLALGYPREWLLAIAKDLATRCSSAIEAETGSEWPPRRSAQAALPVVEKAPDFSNYEELEEQPAGSRVVMERGRDTLSLSVPALGTRQLRARIFAGLFVWFVTFGIMLNLFSADGGRDNPFGETMLLVAVASLAGTFLLVSGLHGARNSAVLTVDGKRLTVRQQGLFGWREREWSRDGLADIFVVPAAGDDDDSWQLQICPRDGNGGAAHLLAWRDIAELRWIATLLRRALRIPDESGTLPAGLVVRSPMVVMRSQ